MTDQVEQLRANAAKYAAPIPGASPAGADVSYDSDFEVVRIEMDKLISMSGETPNWAEVIRQGEQLVLEKSKDMRLLVWIAGARTKRDGMMGFAQGLATVHAVCKDHWEEMFPPIKRAKARGNLASWLGDLVMAQFGEYIPTAKDKDGFDAAEALFNDVDELLSEKLGSNYQGMGPIRTLLRDKRRMLPEPAAAAPTPAPTQQAAQAARPAAVAAPVVATAPAIAAPTVPSMSGAGDVLPALRTVSRSIIEAAGHVRSSEPQSAWAIRLNRIGIWLTVQEPPPDEGGKTRIPPPDDADIARLSTLSQRQQWGELVNQGEDLAAQYLFWLDPHRFSAEGLERLGPTFADAKKAVVSEVLAFVSAQPAILSMTFSDGMPFADEATKSWIEEQQAQLGTGGGGSGSGSGANLKLDEEEAELRARFETARKMVTDGQIGEGLGLAMQLSRRSSDARARFRSRLETGQMALRASRPDLARPILEGLVVEAEEHRLEHWEPALCAQLYAALLKARTAKGATAGTDSQLSNEGIFDRLCRLDPAAAMKAGPL